MTEMAFISNGVLIVFFVIGSLMVNTADSRMISKRSANTLDTLAGYGFGKRSANTLDTLAGHGFGKRPSATIRSPLDNLDPLSGMGFGKRSTAQGIEQMMRYMRVKQLLEQFRKIPDDR